jgi:hypothetical protein
MSEVRVISATMVDTIRTCPLKARYRYVERLPERQKSGALVLGIAVDVAAKHIVHGLRGGHIQHGAVDVEGILREAWNQELAAAKDIEIVWGERGSEEKGRATAVALLAAFANLPDLRQRVARIVDVDVRFQIPIPDPVTGRARDDVAVQGILDFVERLPDGRVRALDLKTASSRAGYEPDDLAVHLQGALYCVALRAQYGDRASDQFAVLLGLKLKVPVIEDRVVTLGASAQRRALLTALHAKRLLDLGISYPVRNWGCPSCAYARPCAAWQDSMTAQLRHDPFARVG